ncbi:hypothetical protein ACG83_11010 [Frankia sp. R43]|uniref:hypothetical protein n=1 Tax=Frankia sp. R43 TaxID=269536 RepID=UPI0006C9FFBC|nr:hypothetical protein [Frankia sp. R43]KPM55794.1 hypothetical protein ACG83_11010 [Frankia sp. R43]
MTTWRYSKMPAGQPVDARVNTLFNLARIGDLFERPAETADARLWVVTRDPEAGRLILQVEPKRNGIRVVDLHEVPADIIPLRRGGGSRG